MNDSTPPEGKRRFKETRTLVRLALDDGMTQTEIARICRTQQSTVSAWANGERKAWEKQVEPLLARYGRQLRRSSERVYLVEGPAEAWEGSELARMFAEARPEYEGHQQTIRDAKAAIKKLDAEAKKAGYEAAQVAPGNQELDTETLEDLDWPLHHSRRDPRGESYKAAFEAAVEGQAEARTALEAEIASGTAACTELLMSVAQWPDLGKDTLDRLLGRDDPFPEAMEHLEAAARHLFLARHRAISLVEGPVLFRHVFSRPFVLTSRAGERLCGEPVSRWLIHTPSSAQFVLVRQRRLELPALLKVLWWKQPGLMPRHDDGVSKQAISHHVHSPDDDARWLSVIEGPMDLEALLARADRFAAAPEGFATVHDQLTLPFRLRKALIEHGYPVPGLRRIGAS